ncbi:ATP-dependent helicase [Cellulophaga sp. F20128]|uniref:UvrD-helicase domain-containing protein n=1 Tax=Cellulophaga sp. F20128 TaxID=2926413 RepID=UPI001FF2C686|nr:ATP-dependent helicase [Cellulophaga sp. F20128]MCK0158928.1 ATP-dependent helicase [Cellulophaga sp. F20128]
MAMQVISSNNQIDIEQHFKVVAGPGAGKTTFLVNHIRNVLTNSERLGVNRKVACITYTNVGVDTLVDRVKDERDNIEISTIHSFLFVHVVKPYLFLISDKYGLNPSMFDSPFEHIFSNGFFRSTNLPTRFRVQESEMKKVFWEINGETCILRLPNRNRNVQQYHNSLLRYKTAFWEKGIMHYDDILAFAWEIVNKDSSVLRILRAKFPYFFIDEFQDTSPIQSAILKLIANEETIVGVIGDEAQSIYSFQGASMQQFIDFTLPNINEFVIPDNHRSTLQIISVLNTIRGSITQTSPEAKAGDLPKIIVGDSIAALEECERLWGEKNVVSLSYMVPTANAMRKRVPVESAANNIIEELFSVDSNRDRKKVIISVIKSVEFAKQNLFNDAIKELSRHFRNQDLFKGHKSALIFIKSYLNLYNEISNETLWQLYERLQASSIVSLSRIRESKTAEMTRVEAFYKETSYKDLALTIRLLKDASLHRTIHKAKGDEFNNVLVIVKGRFGNRYNEERDLAFLLNPELNSLEEHRVNYVACSRAKENLIINVPELSQEASDTLATYFDISSV